MNSHDMLEQKITTALAQALLETYGIAPADLVRDIGHRVCAEVERYREGQKAVFGELADLQVRPRLNQAAASALNAPLTRERDRVPFEDHYPLPVTTDEVA